MGVEERKKYYYNMPQKSCFSKIVHYFALICFLFDYLMILPLQHSCLPKRKCCLVPSSKLHQISKNIWNCDILFRCYYSFEEVFKSHQNKLILCLSYLIENLTVWIRNLSSMSFLRCISHMLSPTRYAPVIQEKQ